MAQLRIVLLWLLLACTDTGYQLEANQTESNQAELFQRFEREVQPLLTMYCTTCHSSPEPKGRIDLASIRTAPQVEGAYEQLHRAVELLEAGNMPPADEPQPTESEKQQLKQWFDQRFVGIEAKAAPFQPRRLSALEYRNTLRTLIGFELEVSVIEAEETITEKSMVMKLLPTDPPGASGFRNDTYRNPISAVAWDRYSQLADLAIEELFSSGRRTELAALAGPISDTGFSADNARQLLQNWFTRVYRRPLNPEQVNAVVTRVASESDIVRACQAEMKVSLMSPRFLYRGLLEGSGYQGSDVTRDATDHQRAVDDFELAERLSYFLWASMPDASLFEAAARGSLHDEAVLVGQIERMLDRDQAHSLADDLVVQWLLLSEINEVSDDVPIVAAYKSQAIDFVRYLIVEDRPLLELIDSKVEFINMYTAGFYGEDRKQLKAHHKPAGIEVQTVPNQRIELISTQDRGGVLTMPGILAMNRGAIIRGTWILERILGDYLPDPPANVGQVKANAPGEELTFRQRFEQHRAQSSCALCHDKIDPLGFVLESYDVKGTLISDKTPDTSGQLPSGETFRDVRELKTILSTSRRHQVLQNIARQFMAYALCRRIEYYDQPTIDAIVNKLDNMPGHGTYQQLIREIVLSEAFREARFSR